MLTTSPRGTKDILPDISYSWRYIENIIHELCQQAAYQEIRTPIFEHTELFLKGIGETTDIVEKEMYVFTDLGQRSLSLRPENTAAIVRSYLENKLYATLNPAKLYYIGPMFRYDRPQAGRYRQFHQFGIEVIGAKNPLIDAEVISLAIQFFQRLGLSNLSLQINSVGCPVCRPIYREKLQVFFKDKLPYLCKDCNSRYEKNPMRLLDCKNKKCKEYFQGVPHIIDYLCDECNNHFEKLQSFFKAADIEFLINKRLVRGLDYYTKTAFEIKYKPLGAQSAVCGGGRYDGLIEQCGGQTTPAIGFAIGIERTFLALEKQNLLPKKDDSIKIFIAPIGEKAKEVAFRLVYELRNAHISAETDYLDKSIKAQMKSANKYPAEYVAIIGEDELLNNQVMLKNMKTSKQELVNINDLKKEIFR